MAGERAVKAVSWRHAYKDGLAITFHHKVLLLIAAFSAVCERSITLFTDYTGVSIEQAAIDYRDLLASSPYGIDQDLSVLLPYRGLMTFLPLACGLFILGAFLLVGLLGLLRDLLTRRGYRVQEVFVRGREYFWTIFKFKLPIYVVNSTFIAVVAPPLLSFRGERGAYVFWVSIASFTSFLLFAAARVPLSLGPKIIVVEELRRVIAVYRRVTEVIKPVMGQTAIFYMILMGIVGLGFLVPMGITRLGLPAISETVLSVFFIAFVTVVMKASSFSFYLQLLSVSAASHGDMSCETSRMAVAPVGISRRVERD